MQTLKALEVQIATSKTSKASAAQFLKFRVFCQQQSVQWTPLTYNPVALYVVHYTNRNKSTRSLGSLLSQLKAEVTARHVSWLTDQDAIRLKKLTALLRFEDTSQSRRKSALRLSHLIEIVALLDLSRPAELLKATELMVGHDALLRGGELASGIKAHQITWWPRDKGFSLSLPRTKTVRQGAGVLINVPDYDHNPVSGVKLLKRWWLSENLAKRPSAFVFPAIRYGSIDKSKMLSTAHLRKFVKEAASSIGLDPINFSAHSLRAGGATDLFAANVPYHIIKKMGRWVSDAAMLYYRSEEDAWAAVGAAFSALAALHQTTR